MIWKVAQGFETTPPRTKSRTNTTPICVLDMQLKRLDPETGQWKFMPLTMESRLIYGAVMEQEEVQVWGGERDEQIDAVLVKSETTGAEVYPVGLWQSLFATHQPAEGDEPALTGKVIFVQAKRTEGVLPVEFLDLWVQHGEENRPVTNLVQMRGKTIRGSVMKGHVIDAYGRWEHGLLRAKRIVCHQGGEVVASRL